MKKSERIALDTFLSSYPNDDTYENVLRRLEYGDEEILVWEPFEYDPKENVCEWIDNLREHIAQEYEDK